MAVNPVVTRARVMLLGAFGPCVMFIVSSLSTPHFALRHQEDKGSDGAGGIHSIRRDISSRYCPNLAQKAATRAALSFE
jgi:hypothetical protein